MLTWISCRNRYGDVLRVSVTGGAPELVLPNPVPEAVPWSPYAFIYPDGVSFGEEGSVLVRWASSHEEEQAAWPSTLQLPELGALPEAALPPQVLRALAPTAGIVGEWRRLPESSPRGVYLGPNSILMIDGPAVRWLIDGALVFAVEPKPFVQRGRCCGAEEPEVSECTLPPILRGAWLDASARQLVTLRSAASNAPGCELEPRIDRIELPFETAPLRDFPLVQ